MNPHYAFELKNIFIETVVFRRNPNFDRSKGPISINTKISVGHEYRDKKELIVSVRAILEEEESLPFSFNVEGIGSFKFHTNPPEETIDRIAKMNCASIIFPYVRETIGDLTRRAGLTPLHLQPVNFVAMYEAEQSSKIKKPVGIGQKISKKTKAKIKGSSKRLE